MLNLGTRVPRTVTIAPSTVTDPQLRVDYHDPYIRGRSGDVKNGIGEQRADRSFNSPCTRPPVDAERCSTFDMSTPKL